jgi:hypothetical protein
MPLGSPNGKRWSFHVLAVPAQRPAGGAAQKRASFRCERDHADAGEPRAGGSSAAETLSFAAERVSSRSMPIGVTGRRRIFWRRSWTWLLVLPACGAEPPPRVAEAPALVETANAAAGGTGTDLGHGALALPIPTAPDTSLTLAVYRAAGVPDVDRSWSVEDYQRCLDVFVELVRTGRGDLPRAASSRSGALFARVVDARNFETPSGVTAGNRARRLRSYLEVFPGFLKVYSPASDGIDFSVEQAALIVGLLELLKSSLSGSRDYGAVDASWTSEYERQRQVTLGVVRGARTMLAEPERYSISVRRHIKAHLKRLAPELESHLDQQAAQELHAIALE